eukprot:TRINITY_DN58497_c0_g1_i1.p1 TRINITY_DN58497_c0_g1~~TRINITY_DN58497_c0_g1_i1.p1  ORF type:complete len:364 (-),score=47.48 TRINITY_DN58497_c0_g1_i1:26-1117(-)
MRILVSALLLVGAAHGQNHTTLRQAAGSRLFMGAEANHGTLYNSSEPIYKSVHTAQYSMITPENCCKWGATQPQQGQFTLDACTQTLQYAISANQEFRGHNLCWGSDNPQWLLNGGFKPDQLKSILENHISTVSRGLRKVGKVYCWDVVNEAVSDSNPPALKTNVWYPALMDYIDIAFNATSIADPDTKLFYNDYSTETVNPKSTYIYNMVQGMLSRKVPIHGVGFQFHINVNVDNLGQSWLRSSRSGEDALPAGQWIQSVKDNFHRFGQLGVEIHITELDVACENCDSQGLQREAQVYADLLSACLAEPKCKNFETWGFTDKYTWLWSFNNPNHIDMKPLPFDANYKPKPAFNSMLAVLNGH